MSSFLGVDPRAMMGTVGGMVAGMAIIYAGRAIGARMVPASAGAIEAGAWLAGAAVAVGIAQRFADGDPRPALFAGGFLYLATLQTLFTTPHPVWAMAVGGLGVPLTAALAWWITRAREDEA